MLLKPGKYRFAELAEICGTSRTTAEKFPKRYDLPETTVLYEGRQVSGVELNHDHIERISQDYPKVIQGDVKPLQLVPDTQVKEESKGNDALVEQLQNTNESLKNEKIQLEDKLNSKISTLEEEKKAVEAKLSEAKDTIAELRTSVALLEAKAEAHLKENESHDELIEQYKERLKDKDITIQKLEDQVASEKSRADAFNNQVAGQKDLVLASKSAKSFHDEMQQQMKALHAKVAELQAKTTIEVREPEPKPHAEPPKGFRAKLAALIAGNHS